MSCHNQSKPSLAVREEMERISNEELDGDSNIVELLAKLATVRANTLPFQMAFESLARLVAAFPDEIVAANAKITDLKAKRPDAIAAGLIAGACFEEDDQLRAAIAAEELMIERLTICQSAMERRVNATRSQMETAGSSYFGITDEIEKRRDELRRDLAEKRCN